MDFSKFKINGKYYGGSERKIGITINLLDYIVKFQKITEFGLRNNHICEYIGCEIFRLLGFKTQEVILGTYKEKEVVVLKDFIKGNDTFVAFNDVGESTIDEDKEKYQYSYDDITKMLRLNNKLDDLYETIDIFWEIFIVDGLLGNFDRHGGNWGFIKHDNKYILSPVFDNGSCLFPNLSKDNMMLEIINDTKETNKRIYKFPTSQILLNGKKSSYFEVISSLQFKSCNIALEKIYHKIDLEKINNMIDNIDQISSVGKSFYKYIIEERYKKIIKFSYNKLTIKAGDSNEIS